MKIKGMEIRLKKIRNNELMYIYITYVAFIKYIFCSKNMFYVAFIKYIFFNKNILYECNIRAA
jgi:hypothetical protein